MKFKIDSHIKADVEDILKRYKGNEEVIIVNADDKKAYKLPYKIQINIYLVNELYALLSSENVKVVEK